LSAAQNLAQRSHEAQPNNPTPEMHSEGPNVRLSRIRQGGSNFEFTSLALNTDKGIIGVKSDDADT